MPTRMDDDAERHPPEVASLVATLAALKASRKRQKLSLAAVSARCGLDKATLSRLENGKILNPEWKTVRRYADALGVGATITTSGHQAEAIMKEMELVPDRRYIQEALKARPPRARIEDLSLKVVKADTRFQARANHLDMGHVRRLGAIRDMGVTLEPIVVFEDPETLELKITDGFHRHKEALIRGDASIRAYVVAGTDHEARLFAAMCNQETLLERRPEDLEKAIAILMDDEECREWPLEQIAGHVGCAVSTAKKYRAIYFDNHELPIPEGRVRTPTPPAGPKHPAPSSGTVKARPKDADANQTPPVEEAGGRQSLDYRALESFFYNRGLVIRPPSAKGLHPAIAAAEVLVHKQCICATIQVKDGPRAFYTAVARVLMFREWQGADARAVVLCYPEDYERDKVLITAGRGLGVEFLTPMQLVESLKGSPRGR
jgi:transcriptional regulator with XRE-family HTH domain